MMCSECKVNKQNDNRQPCYQYLFDHNFLKPEIKNRKTPGKYKNIGNLKNKLQITSRSEKNQKGNVKKKINKLTWKYGILKFVGYSKSSSKREIYS